MWRCMSLAESVQDGDLLVLCTDGLWTFVEEEELRSIVEQYDPQESAKRLVERANENGGSDIYHGSCGTCVPDSLS